MIECDTERNTEVKWPMPLGRYKFLLKFHAIDSRPIVPRGKINTNKSESGYTIKSITAERSRQEYECVSLESTGKYYFLQ